jgi:nicotinamidase/pyrazinamidase
MNIRPDDALVIVDPQNDFLPGGSLAVAEGHRIFAPINRLIPHFARVYATRDWHPPDHAFFEAHGGPWPFHCLADTPGAAFSERLDADRIDVIVSKGTDPQPDGYSGCAATELADDLRAHGIRRIFVCGLATDYCVKATALDARRLGFEVVVIVDAIAAVKVNPNDEAESLEAMRDAGVRLAASEEIERGAAVGR